MLNRIAKIEAQAYAMWEQMGYPHGADWDHWLQAERQVDTQLLASIKPAKPKKSAAKKATKAS